MTRLCSLQEYKDVLKWNKSRFDRVIKNNVMLSSAFEEYIQQERLYFEVYDEGLVIYLDEGAFYKAYYYWNDKAEFANFKKSKPVLIEEIYVSGKDDGRLKGIGKRLCDGGFRFLKNNLQVEKDLLKAGVPSVASFEMITEMLKEKGLSVCIGNDMDNHQKSVKLWKEFLDLTDIPFEHISPSPQAKLVCLVDENHNIVGTNWMSLFGKTSECRHTVVIPKWYRQGLGTIMLDIWCAIASSQKITKCFTWISDSNYRSLGLYKKNGFYENGKICRQFILE